MDTNSVERVGVNQYTNSNTNQKVTSNVKSFKNEVQKAKESQNRTTGSSASKWEGDIVISEPPNYSYYTYDSSISNKSKEEMTINEYKQWFINRMSKIQVSGYYRASFVGSTVITEDAFKEMKANPEWEKTVLNMLREGYSVNGLPQRSYCYQVIGASPAETYGYTVPIKSGSDSSIFSGTTKSWWQRRFEKSEEILKEHKIIDEQNWLNSQFLSQQSLQIFLMERAQSEQKNINTPALQTVGLPAYEIAAMKKL